MEQLSGLDASFLYFETTKAPTHIGSFAIYDQATAPGGKVTFTGILKNVESRLHLARCFRQKLVHSPLDLDHPYWIEDPDFDIEFHVRHIALPQPGDWRQLCIQVARLHARPLDLSKPLWEMYVIEGLDGVEGAPPGSFAVMTKIHHAAIDGVSGAELATAIHDIEPEATVTPAEKPWIPERDPSMLELTLRAAANNVRSPFRLARMLTRNAAGLSTLFRSDPTQEVEDESDGDVPRTRFNGQVSSHRVIEGRTFSLQDIRDIRKRVLGATVNDVVLAICSGALRQYLDHHGELPDAPLKALAPISVRTAEEAGTAGNKISMMGVGLHSDEADPLERLRRIHETTRASKATSQAVGARTMTDATQFMPGVLAGLAARVYTQLGLATRIKPIGNTIITNVPGPQIPLFFTGARMVALHGLGPIMDGMGLIHPVFSYSGKISIAITACRDQLPDPGFYAQCLQDSFDALWDACENEGPSSEEQAPTTSRGRSVLHSEQERLGDEFFQGDAEEHRQHLQLAMEEAEARTRIAEATGIQDESVLAELAGLGIRVETLSALALFPLVHVAWADGEMDDRERGAVLEAAAVAGLESDSISYRLLEIWTLERPPVDLLNAWKGFVGALQGELEGTEAENLARNLLGRAERVAKAAGDALDRSAHVSDVEQKAIDELRSAFEG